jgi:hypothetical protein
MHLGLESTVTLVALPFSRLVLTGRSLDQPPPMKPGMNGTPTMLMRSDRCSATNPGTVGTTGATSTDIEQAKELTSGSVLSYPRFSALMCKFWHFICSRNRLENLW